MKYKLIRSNRKHLAIQITEEGELIARAPKHMPVREIDAFVKQKRQWIEKHQSRAKMRERMKKSFVMDYGASVLVLGDEYTIHQENTDRIFLDQKNAFIHMPSGLSPEEIRLSVIDFYRQLASDYLTGRVGVYAPKIHVKPAAVKISRASKRWGSCSGKGNINFSYRLIAAPPDAIDYVVIHECCHLLEMNHSPRFWDHVSKLCPDYNEMKNKLHAVSERLTMQNL